MEHERARKFIYETWPRLDTARRIRSQLGRARQVVRICLDAGDSLSPNKLLLASVAHTNTLQKELDALKKRDGEDARDQTRIIEEVASGLETLLKEVSDSVSKK